MKRLCLAATTVCVLAASLALSWQTSDPSPPTASVLQIQTESRNPWTNLQFSNDPQEFQFAIVSDRTGTHRERIFSRAVEQLNLLQPEFVLSVGDLIEGYSTDRNQIAQQWREFQSFTSKLQMPFFYTVGNHDITNPTMEKVWEEKFGRRYYHFIFKDVLFLILCTEDPPHSGDAISPAQVNFARKVLQENQKVRWTIVALHRPVWTGDIEKNGWGEVEKSLAGRNYTVFAGHIHRYQKFVRQGMNYYQLATTGGGSLLRGVKYGEFDHIVWATMRKNGPVLANIMLDGIVPEDLHAVETVEPGMVYDWKRTQPVRGYVYVDGTPAAGASIGFHLKMPNSTSIRLVADALIEGDGSYVLSSSQAFDGAPMGDYLVTLACDGRFAVSGNKPNIELPEKYAKPATSGLTASVKTGQNQFTFELKR